MHVVVSLLSPTSWLLNVPQCQTAHRWTNFNFISWVWLSFHGSVSTGCQGPRAFHSILNLSSVTSTLAAKKLWYYDVADAAFSKYWPLFKPSGWLLTKSAHIMSCIFTCSTHCICFQLQWAGKTNALTILLEWMGGSAKIPSHSGSKRFIYLGVHCLAREIY